MLDKILQPAMIVLKTHLALAGFKPEQIRHYESDNLDLEPILDYAQRGQETCFIVYDRQRLSKLPSQPRAQVIQFEDGKGRMSTRKAIVASLPFSITVVTNKLKNLDNYEVLQRLELLNKSFNFPAVINKDVVIEYTLSYSDVSRANNDIDSLKELKGGFHQITFTAEVQGMILSPYSQDIDIVNLVDFHMILSDLPKKPEPDIWNSINLLIK